MNAPKSPSPQWWLDRATTFRIDLEDGITPVEIQQNRQRSGKALWSVQCGGRILNRSSKWEYDRVASNRDDAYMKRCRFESPENALQAYLKWKQAQPNPNSNPATIPVDLT